MSEVKVNARPSCFINDYNALIFTIESIVNKINTVELVRVEKVNNDNTIDVIPIVRNATTDNEPIEESIIYGVRYLMWQYGVNAIKAIPEVGDIGLIVICKKDISDINNGLIGSFRKFCPADGVYVGGLMGFNQTPTQFIEFSSSGINITSPAAITVTSTTDLTINANSATINATAVNLGGTGGAAVARVGDSVVNGKITTGSSVVKAL